MYYIAVMSRQSRFKIPGISLCAFQRKTGYRTNNWLIPSGNGTTFTPHENAKIQIIFFFIKQALFI